MEGSQLDVQLGKRLRWLKTVIADGRSISVDPSDVLRVRCQRIAHFHIVTALVVVSPFFGIRGVPIICHAVGHVEVLLLYSMLVTVIGHVCILQ